MIDENILDEIVPVPDTDAKIQELKGELAAEGSIIAKWGSGGVSYWLTHTCVQIHTGLLRLTRAVLNSQFPRHAEGRWLELEVADFSKLRKVATRTQGYMTLIRPDYGQALTVIKEHMFKTVPDIDEDELVYYALGNMVIRADQAEGSVPVEVEATETCYNVSGGQIRIGMVYLEGVSRAMNRQGWIYSEGADEGNRAGLHSQTLSSREELSTNTTSARLKAAVGVILGMVYAYIDDQYPRGQGMADVIAAGAAGGASEELARKAQAVAGRLKDSYENYLAEFRTTTYQDMDIVLYFKQGAGVANMKETAQSLIAGVMSLPNRTDFNLFLRDDTRYILRQSVPDYRETVFIVPAVDMELPAGNMVILGVSRSR